MKADYQTHQYKVTVSNIGTVYEGTEAGRSDEAWDNYQDISQRGSGRAGGETVRAFCDGVIYAEYKPENNAK